MELATKSAMIKIRKGRVVTVVLNSRQSIRPNLKLLLHVYLSKRR